VAYYNNDWEPSKMEKYAEKWFSDHGYQFRLLKRFISKSIYEVSKDGIACEYHVASKVADPAGFMRGFEQFWGTYSKVYGV